MKLHALLLSSVLSAALGCGGSKKPPPTPENETSGDAKDGGTTASTSDKSGDDGGAEDQPKKDACLGFEIANLDDMLVKSSCEVPYDKAGKQAEVKDKLEVIITPNPPKVAPGGHVDLVVTFHNKTKDQMPLIFQIDPTPRFETEAYDAKGKRVDIPAGTPPPLKTGEAPRGPSGDPKAARVTLAPNGNAKYKLGWDASKMKWAPEKVKGTPPEKGYPKSPAGPLPKGKYTIRVVTPLIGINDGMDREISAPKIEIAVEK